MPGKGLIIAVAVLAVLGGLVWWSNSHPQETTNPDSATGTPKILSIPDADIVRVTISRKGSDDTVLERQPDNSWRLTKPVALATDSEAVQAFILALSSLTSEKVADDKPADLAPFGLKDPFLRFTLGLKNNRQRVLSIGDDAPVGGGSFTLVDGDARVFTIGPATRANLDKHGPDLRDRRLLTFDPAKLARVELALTKTTLEFSKSGPTDWTMLKPKPARADSWAVDELVRQLKEAKLDATLASDQENDLLKMFSNSAPFGTITVTDASGAQKLELRKGKEDRLYAKSSQLPGAHLLGPEALKAFDKSADDFRNKKLFDFGFSDPTRVDYKEANRTLSLQKNKDGWLAAGKPVDSVGVQNLIDRLRDLSATKFVDTGFSNPSIEISVTAKAAEKISISKAGDRFIARRDGDPTLYELDSKSVADLQSATDIKARPQEPAPKAK